MILSNRRIQRLSAAALLTFFASQEISRAQAPTKPLSAIIDVQKILAESEEGKREMANIKKLQEQKVEELRVRENEVQKLKEKLTDLGFSISDEERTKMQRQIEDRVIEGERFRKDADREVKSKFEDVFAEFEKRIYPIIEEIGTERGIQIIFNRDMPGLVWADKSVDVTQAVIERFNQKTATK